MTSKVYLKVDPVQMEAIRKEIRPRGVAKFNFRATLKADASPCEREFDRDWELIENYHHVTMFNDQTVVVVWCEVSETERDLTVFIPSELTASVLFQKALQIAFGKVMYYG